MTAPLFIAHDGLLGVNLAPPEERAAAGARATRASIEAGERGERVTVPGGTDRFTVIRASCEAVE